MKAIKGSIVIYVGKIPNPSLITLCVVVNLFKRLNVPTHYYL
jgi:hypothetical protein